MADNVIFEDYTIKVQAAMENAVIAGLEEAAGELESQAKRKTVRKTSHTNDGWQHRVVDSEMTAYIGNTTQNSIWEEFGTGEHAITENGGKGGRKGYWVFVDDGGNGDDYVQSVTSKAYSLKEAKRVMAILRGKGLEAYYTNGKKARRPFWNAYKSSKNTLIKIIEDRLKGM